MKTKVLWMFVFAMMIAGASAFAAEATQIWKCELDDDATEEQAMKAAQEWLAAAKTMKGGENFEAYVYFPVAVNGIGEFDLFFVVVAPTFKEWGEFWDGYGGSPAAKVDKGNEEIAVCPDSAVWESIKVE